MSGDLSSHYERMAKQLVDSTLPSTRMFWRTKLGATEAQACDPRPLSVVLNESPTPSVTD